MTDTPEPGVTTTATFTDYFAQAEARERLRSEFLPANKAVIFDALVAAGIVAVDVTFDGCGDSGQIESIDARSAAGAVALPDVAIEIASPSYTDSGIDRRTQPLAEAIETIAYDLLGATHCGWENNDGAYGEFAFDVVTRVVSLHFNGRYTAIDSSSHEF